MVGPHSPEAKIRHELSPALATTVRPLLAIRTRWAKTSGWRQARGGSATDGAIFVAIVGLHQDRADAVGAHRRRQRAIGQPFAFEIAAHLRPARIDRAAARGEAMLAGRSGRLLQFRDLQRRAAHRARAAAFAGSWGQDSRASFGADAHSPRRLAQSLYDSCRPDQWRSRRGGAARRRTTAWRRDRRGERQQKRAGDDARQQRQKVGSDEDALLERREAAGEPFARQQMRAGSQQRQVVVEQEGTGEQRRGDQRRRLPTVRGNRAAAARRAPPRRRAQSQPCAL